MITDLKKLYLRDLKKLKTEIVSFNEESNIWKTRHGITNSSGNLCLHLCGNLNTFIGQQLGGTDYVRDRTFEFAGKDIARDVLVRQIDEVTQVIEDTFNQLSDQDLERRYPLDFLGYEMTIGYCLTHLLGHFSYHLGQVNYLRRLLEANE